MLKIIKNIKRKLRSGSAETLTETLVSVLIISIVSVGLASMISTAANINQIARDYDQSLDQAIGTLTTGTADDSTTINIQIKTQGKDPQTIIATETFGNALDTPSNGSVYVRGDSDLELYGYTYTAAPAKTTGTA